MKRFWFILAAVLVVFSVLPPAAASGRASQAPLLATTSPTVIPGRYIVVFNDNAPQAEIDAAIGRAEQAQGAVILFRYADALKGFAASLAGPALEALRNNPNVAYIEADQEITIDTTQTPATWGLDRIDQRNLPLSNSYSYTNTGAAVTAYVIDTGITITHPDFGGRASVGTDTVGDGRNGIDCNGHGTHVSGTIGGTTFGVAKAVSLVAVRVLNCRGLGSTSGVIAGVNWVTGNHQAGQPAVANMSLGGSASASLDTAVANSITDGVVYAIAAGNSSRNACNFSPARVPAAITVGATNKTDTRPFWSNFGSCLDLFAPGANITSDWLDNGTKTISGTSMATPHVAGVAALYLQSNPGASPLTVRNAIVANGTAGVVKKPGSGSPNVLLFTNY